MKLAAFNRLRYSLSVGVGEYQNLARRPVLYHAGDQSLLIEADLTCIHGDADRSDLEPTTAVTAVSLRQCTSDASGDRLLNLTGAASVSERRRRLV